MLIVSMNVQAYTIAANSIYFAVGLCDRSVFDCTPAAAVCLMLCLESSSHVAVSYNKLSYSDFTHSESKPSLHI